MDNWGEKEVLSCLYKFVLDRFVFGIVMSIALASSCIVIELSCLELLSVHPYRRSRYPPLQFYPLQYYCRVPSTKIGTVDDVR